MLKKYLRTVAGFLLILATGLTLQQLQFADWADRALVDAEFRFLRRHFPQPVEKDVVVVGINEATFQTLREPFAMWHPHLGRFMQAMVVAKPSAVGLDVVLPDRSFHFLIPQYDQPLVNGLVQLKAHAPIALAQTIDENGNLTSIFPPYLSAAGKDALGTAVICRDQDQVIRRFDETLCGQGETRPSLAGRMAESLGVKQDWHGLINYAIGDPINYIAFQQVLDWFDVGNVSALTAAFRGKPVLLGAILPFSDRHPLPVALAAFEPNVHLLPGVLVHAQVLRSMLQQGLIKTTPQWRVLMFSALALLAWFGTSNWRKAVLFALGALGLSAASLLMLWKGTYLPAASIILAALLALLARALYDAMMQARKRRFLQGAFSSYVSPRILEEIMNGRIRPELAGTRRTICVMFCDIRSFTALAEKMPPEEVIALLNEHFAGITAAIHKHEGTINKFLGDGLLAFFGAPQPMDSPEKNALEAAQDMLVAALKLNTRLQAAGKTPISVGIGLHSGEAVLGNVGGQSHMEYTAIGDVVKIASRLEALTRDVGYPVVCSKAVADAVGRAGNLTDLGERALRGHAPLHVHGWNPPVLAEYTQLSINPG